MLCTVSNFEAFLGNLLFENAVNRAWTDEVTLAVFNAKSLNETFNNTR